MPDFPAFPILQSRNDLPEEAEEAEEDSREQKEALQKEALKDGGSKAEWPQNAAAENREREPPKREESEIPEPEEESSPFEFPIEPIPDSWDEQAALAQSRAQSLEGAGDPGFDILVTDVEAPAVEDIAQKLDPVQLAFEYAGREKAAILCRWQVPLPKPKRNARRFGTGQVGRANNRAAGCDSPGKDIAAHTGCRSRAGR